MVGLTQTPTSDCWHDLPVTVLDLESTGLDLDNDRIITAAIGYCGGPDRLNNLHTLLCDPGVPIPAEASAVHGWTAEKIRDTGPRSPEDMLSILLGFLDERPNGSAVVVMNAPYDLTLLDRECRRHGLELPDAHRPLHVVDPRQLDLHLHRYRKGSRKLADLCVHYGAQVLNTHAAGWDALAAGWLALCIAKRANVIRRVNGPEDAAELEQLQAEWLTVKDDLPQLHAAQVRWARAARNSLAEHKRSKGESELADRILAEDWPMIPATERVG